MKKSQYTILVTGVGAIIGYGIIKSLRKSGYNLVIIGMDIFADAVGRHWCDYFEQAVRTDTAEYLTFLFRARYWILARNIAGEAIL